MNPLEIAADLNNKGAMALMSGSRETAFKFFEKALDVIEHYSRFDPSAPLQNPPYETTSAAEVLPYLPCTALAPPASCMQDELAKTTTDGNDCDEMEAFIFKKAFVFTPGVPLRSTLVEAYTAVILYNQGLIYHHYLPPQNNGRLKLADTLTALRLYNRCLHLFTTAVPDPSAFSNSIIAILNNKAQLHYSQHEFETSRIILDQLGTIMCNVENDRLSFYESDIDGLLTNIACCQHTVVSAPAA